MRMIQEPLFVFEMANNHMGDVSHGLRIIREIHSVARDFSFRFAFKLQFRDLDTFIHPAWTDRLDIKYVKRFKETRLAASQFRELVDAIKEAGMLVMCTPFDEPSMDLLDGLAIEMIKIASCSFTDWPLLERVVLSNKPIVASTAAASLADMDRVVSFFQHRQRDLALLHCIGLYPAPRHRLELNQLDLLKQRYPGVTIGYSGHEAPDELDVVRMAIAKGATVFEKHVGVPTPAWPLNGYSASPAHVAKWLGAAHDALAMCGRTPEARPACIDERVSLDELRRGVFAKRALAAGEEVRSSDVFLAFPPQSGQWLANDWSKYTEWTTCAPLEQGAPLTRSNCVRHDRQEQVWAIARRVKTLLARGHIVVPAGAELEISHHYGLERFDEFGLTIITVINREYCKKLLVLLPGQTHPEQYHLKKEETFLVLDGKAEITLDGSTRTCKAGDLITVPRTVRHQFSTTEGAVFEELSSTHHTDDSYYTDTVIMQNTSRKSFVRYWLV